MIFIDYIIKTKPKFVEHSQNHKILTYHFTCGKINVIFSQEHTVNICPNNIIIQYFGFVKSRTVNYLIN